MLRRVSLAAALFGAAALSVAVAAPLGPQHSPDGDAGLVTLAKKGDGGGKGGGGKDAKGPKDGGGGGKHRPRRRHRDGAGGAIFFFGMTYCAITAAECADRYGSGTRRYYWCVRDAGC